MRFVIFIMPFLLLNACTHLNDQQGYIILGDHTSHRVWVYLCGLTRQWDTSEEINNRRILTRIATRERIKILAIKPFSRCSMFDDKLCWPQNNHEEVKDTYVKINNVISDYDISGFIGFSNGAFFLNSAVQKVGLTKPIISIGGGGYVDSENDIGAKIYLIIGKNDQYHYENTILFHKEANKYKKDSVKLIVHDGGHVIPENIIRQVLYDLNKDVEVICE